MTANYCHFHIYFNALYVYMSKFIYTENLLKSSYNLFILWHNRVANAFLRLYLYLYIFLFVFLLHSLFLQNDIVRIHINSLGHSFWWCRWCDDRLISVFVINQVRYASIQSWDFFVRCVLFFVILFVCSLQWHYFSNSKQ